MDNCGKNDSCKCHMEENVDSKETPSTGTNPIKDEESVETSSTITNPFKNNAVDAHNDSYMEIHLDEPSVKVGKKSDKKKGKKNRGDMNEGSSNASGSKSADNQLIYSLQKVLNSMSLAGGSQLEKSAKTAEEAQRKSYRFWSTQPVPKLGDVVTTNEPIEPDKKIDDIRSEPYSLPEGFEWSTIDLNNAVVLAEVYVLLTENYVEDDDSMFRFDYQPEFLKWALQPPGWLSEWHVGVRVIKSNRLVGFISAIPATLNIYSIKRKVVEINFLCVHKKLRSKRVAPVLIREITRRVNLKNIFQAVYTAGVVLPKPLGTCRYWHRSLNPRKLIEVKFSHLSKNMTMMRTIRFYALPDAISTPGFRRMTAEDVAQTHALLSAYLKKFKLSPVFTREDFSYWFLPRPGVVDSYVVENGGKITDFVSYYTLPSTVMNHSTYKNIKAAYSFYQVATKTRLKDLMHDALITAKLDGFDVYNALDLMENASFLETLKFGVGDGNLQYYLYNWKCPSLEPADIALVLQ